MLETKTPKNPEEPFNSRRPLHAAAALVGAVLLAHGAMLRRALVWDDLLILRQLELAGRWRLWDADPFGFVRPGKAALFSILNGLFGARAWGYELAGLAGLIAAVLLFWRLAGRVLGPVGAFAAALVYAVHPLHVEGAGWAAASNGTWALVCALAYYLALIAQAERKTQNAKPIVLTLCFLGALFMKEDAIILPLTGGILMLAAGRRPGRAVLAAMAAQFLIGAGFIAWTRAHSAAAGQALAPLPYPRWIVSLAAPRMILSEILYFLWPFRWAYYREINTHPAAFYSMMALGWVAAAALVIWIGSRVMGVKQAAGTGGDARPILFILFSVAALLPTSNLIPLGNDAFGVRYLTHAGLGLALLAGWCVERVGAWGTVRTGQSPLQLRIPHSAPRILLFSWLAAAVIFSNLYHVEWSSEQRLFTRLAEVNPRAKYVQMLAQLAYGRGEWAQAEALARRALAREPAHADARIVLGMALNQQGRPDAALAEWLAVEQAHPGDTNVAIHLADYYDNRFARDKRPRDFELADQYYRIAAGTPRTDAETGFVNWGLLWAVSGKPDKAIAIWEDGLKRFPNSREMRVNLGIARRQAHK